MTSIAYRRLLNQRLIDGTNNTPSVFTTAKEIVCWMGAVQAQEYERAKWALALRTRGLGNMDIDQALAEGSILRTHVMRPTWHFVTPEDIRWMLMLTAPRVNAISAHYVRKMELDDAIFAKTNAVLAKTLQGGKQLIRTELATVLKNAGISTDGELRMGYILMRAELDAIICSGGKRGNQFTYALLDERAPQRAPNARVLSYAEARAELVRRYFTSHGPATAQDFVWWSGLTMADAKAGIADSTSQLVQEIINGTLYWSAAATSITVPIIGKQSPLAVLLPTYDEFLLSYKDRSASMSPDPRPQPESARDNPIFDSGIVIDGRLVGTWHRTFKGKQVVIELGKRAALSAAEDDAIAEAAQRYAQFAGKTLVLA